MVVTITQASRLVGKARKTIYAHAKAGKLSLSKFGDGRTGVDTSELHRCYGDFKEEVTLKPLQKGENVTDGNAVLDVLTELKNENSLMREEMQKLREEIKNLNNRLGHKPLPNKSLPAKLIAEETAAKGVAESPTPVNEIRVLMAKIKTKQAMANK